MLGSASAISANIRCVSLIMRQEGGIQVEYHFTSVMKYFVTFCEGAYVIYFGTLVNSDFSVSALY